MDHSEKLQNDFNMLKFLLEKQDFENFKFLIDHGKNINCVIQQFTTYEMNGGASLLYFFCYTRNSSKQENYSQVKTLIENGCNINQQKETDGNTALHYAAAQSKVEICQLLIENGADVSITNKVNKLFFFFVFFF
jgi:ankyrin repeat protein